MQVPAPFDYERATSVDHAVRLLDRLGGTARIVAGGHSLLPMMKLRLVNVEYLKVAAQPVQGPWPPHQEPRPDPEAESMPVAIPDPAASAGPGASAGPAAAPDQR